jgi:hypothetical protein
MAVSQEGYVTVKLFVLTVVQTVAFIHYISQINLKNVWQQLECCCEFWREGCQLWNSVGRSVGQ